MEIAAAAYQRRAVALQLRRHALEVGVPPLQLGVVGLPTPVPQLGRREMSCCRLVMCNGGPIMNDSRFALHASYGTPSHATHQPADRSIVEPVENFSRGTIERVQERPAWIVVMEGGHDLSTEPDLTQELEQAFEATVPVVVDLSGVHFMDSAILNALLKARERALAREERSFALVAPPGSFASRVLALVVGTLIPTYPNLADAVAAVSPTA